MSTSRWERNNIIFILLISFLTTATCSWLKSSLDQTRFFRFFLSLSDFCIASSVDWEDSPSNSLDAERGWNLFFNLLASIWNWKTSFQKQLPEMFYKKAVLKNFLIFTGKHLCWVSVKMLQAFRSATLLKKYPA